MPNPELKVFNPLGPHSRERDAIIRIANALMKYSDEDGANGNRLAYALERIAAWCEAANCTWDPMEYPPKE